MIVYLNNNKTYKIKLSHKQLYEAELKSMSVNQLVNRHTIRKKKKVLIKK
jgi:hypothetical protein